MKDSFSSGISSTLSLLLVMSDDENQAGDPLHKQCGSALHSRPRKKA
jgi:hypothetical protein